eukprot:g5706.t1
MNRGTHSDRNAKFTQPYERGTGLPPVQPAHGMDRFGQEFMRQGQVDPVSSRGAIVGRMGESPGSFGHQSPSSFGSNRAIMNYQSSESITPISALNPYTNRWLILGRCTARAEIRKFTNASGGGQVFSFDVIDSDRGEIRCTIFGEAVDLFFPIIEIGNVYRISKATLTKRSKYCHLDHDYEIRLDVSSTVEEVSDQSITREIPFINYKFKSIEVIKDMDVHSVVDVVGIVTNVEPSRTVTKKNGDEVQKKTFTIKDQSSYAIDIVLWDDLATHVGRDIEAAMEDGQIHTVATKGVRVGDFNGVSLNSMPSSNVQLDPDISEANLLKQWALRSGNSLPVQSLRQSSGERLKKQSVLADISHNSMQSEKPSYHTVMATVTFVKDSQMYYAACPLQRNGRQCMKKLIGEDRNFSCEACGQNVDEPNWRFILSLQLRDYTDSQFVTAFDAAEEIMGISAKDLRVVKDTPAFKKYIDNARFTTRVFTLRASMDEWNGDQRLRVNVFRQEEINFTQEVDSLLNTIEKYDDQGGEKETVVGGVGGQGPTRGFVHGSVQPATPPGAGYGTFMGPKIGGGRAYGQ